MAADLLNAEEIFDSAADQSGLGKYADAGMRQRFAQMIDSFNRGGPIVDWKRPAAIRQIEAVVRSRLEVARDFALYPEIEKERIERPFFVVGQTRTGSTIMQSLLALGDGCRTPLSWECRHPSPPPGLDPESEPERIAADNAHQMDFINLAPGLLLSHPYIDQGAFMVTDDEDLIALDFYTPYAWHYTRVPVLSPFQVHNSDMTPWVIEGLRFHKKMLQYLQWKRPTRRWVGKGQYFSQAPALWKVYPDAVCVMVHRDPAIVIASTLGILAHHFTPNMGVTIRGDFAAKLMDGLLATFGQVLNSGWLDDERLVHLRFDDFIHDQAGAVRRIYARGGLEFSQETEARIRAWLADPANKSDRHGKFIATLEQFGLNADDVRKKFADYSARFLS